MADDPGARASVQLPAVFTAGAGAVHLAASVPPRGLGPARHNGLADALTVALEMLAVGALFWRSRATPERGPTGWRRAVVLASAWTLVVAVSTLAIADVGTHVHVEVAETAHDDVAPRSRPATSLVGSTNGPDPDLPRPDADADRYLDPEDGTAHTHAPGEGH